LPFQAGDDVVNIFEDNSFNGGCSLKKRRFISIFRKQLLVASIFALVLATSTSVFQFFSDLARLKNETDATLQQVLLATSAPLQHLLQGDNLSGAKEQLENLFTFAPVVAISLRNPQNRELLQLNRQPSPPPLTWKERLLFGSTHIHFFNMGISAGGQPAWSLGIELRNSLISLNPGRKFVFIFLGHFVLCLLLTLTFQGLLHALFTRQIIGLTHQLNKLKEQSDSSVALTVESSHQNDEMGVLADTISGLWNSRHELQKNLADHNKFVTTVTAISPVGLFRTDTDGDLIWYNQKARVLLGILGYEKSLDEWLGNLHPSHQTDVLQSWREAIEHERPFHAEFPLSLADNKVRWVIGEAIPSWSSGRYEGFVGTLTDVTPLKLATEKLHESEERYHTITQTASSAIILTEGNGTISYWNPAAETIFGYTRKQALNENFVALVIPDHSRHLFAEACPEFEDDSCDNRGQLIELEVRTKNGDFVPVEMSLSAFKMNGKWHAAMFISDISKRITSEREKVTLLDQLRQSQKMEAIGTLAGGIAHDFNNILTPILGFSQLLQGKFEEGTKERDRIEKILTSANRAKDLVGQILSFSRKSKEEELPTLVMPVIKESLKLLRAGIPSTISIKTRFPSSDFWIMADPTRIHQILMNLTTNAVQAMSPKGGTLTVALDQVTQAEVEKLPLQKGGPYLRLRIIDTGTGMDPYTQSRIFDPYFTTKGADAGTGLGLSVVLSSVETLHGHIDLESEVGKGTTFSVYLPLIRGDFQVETAQQTFLPHGSGQHLLLVDDEMSLINIGQEFLEDLGYRVTATSSSRDAMEMIQKEPNRFDLIITDQTMPQLTGMELARQTKKLRPDLPIILCTGQRSQINENDLEEIDILRVLDKPDIFSELADTLKQTFGEASDAQNL
jgi:PAS domain S-box-containing protein